jgi:HK97 family phage prohead protease
MPWHLEKGGGTCRSDQWAVIKDADGSTAGCHATEAAAQAQLAALYANEPGASQMSADCGCEQRDSDHFHLRASVDNSAWDAQAAMSHCSNSNTPASCFGSICAARVSANPADTQAGWALPHHKTAGGPPNAKGVSSALGYLDRTQGIDKQAARRHLERHQGAIQAQSESARAAAQQRAAAAKDGHLDPFPNNIKGRRLPFQPALEIRKIERDGQEFYHLQGTATVYEQPYKMYDIFGEYTEIVARRAGAASLAKNPDVKFLANHEGLSLARTTNGTLELREDDTALHYDAYLNPKRFDVRDLVVAVQDRTIDESSYAFWIDDGRWNDDFTQYRIDAYDIDRGDVSAVNTGANPWTNVAARQQFFLADIDQAPAGLARAAFQRLQHRPDITAPIPAERSAEQTEPQPTPTPQGRSVTLVRGMLRLIQDAESD